MTPPAAHAFAPAIRGSLDGLLRALRPERVGADRFRVTPTAAQFPGRIFGGQLVAQALTAASATVDDGFACSLHAAFVEAGAPERPVDLVVDRVRDGRSFATRHVTVSQGGRTLLDAIASFRANTAGAPPRAPSLGDEPGVTGRSPEELPLIQDWVGRLPAARRERAGSWVASPPAVEIRMAEAPTFLGGSPAPGTRSHWMRLPYDVGDDPALHTALLAYASDFFLMDIVFRAHPDVAAVGNLGGFSLDHAVWLHRPVRFDRWHVHTQEALAISGDRGLARGVIHDEAGQLVATVAQDVLVRPITRPEVAS
ncbi:thioesterase family protein [Yinghuangia sp. ASG 101]|uniref:acyl-CoA thioesterase n=1 Tax=Yinghuangia sp. ASG 101 TaxID=2896848 RepID=UPI001E53C4D2|nr:acyl-CoA thioesterase domain-containing protein [Yinghuangia sp. ASG 101]UGQ11887.1 thioesterase family protein [Yinghuangia sp. ASG 101]